MKKTNVPILNLAIGVFALALFGCSRTVEDVARWERGGRIEKLINAFEDPKPEIRNAAAAALGVLRAEAAVDPLAALFDDSDTNVVYTAAEALLKIGNRASAMHLMLALRLDQPRVRLLAAEGLGDLMQTNAVSELARALDDSNAEVALTAASALKKIGAESASEALAVKLADASEELGLACVDALSITGGEAAAEGLIPAMKSDRPSIQAAAKRALIRIGVPCQPALLRALRTDHKVIRRGVLEILAEMNAIPSEGAELIWYRLAQAAAQASDELDEGLIEFLAAQGEDALPDLLVAAAHSSRTIREHAIFAIEPLGDAVLPKLAAVLEDVMTGPARAWYDRRQEWIGAPAARLDLWAGLTALNPNFEFDGAKQAYLRLRGEDARQVFDEDDFSATREYALALIELLDDSEHAETARRLLAHHGRQNMLPLICALSGTNEVVSGRAAEIIGEFRDRRAVPALMEILERKLESKQELTTSPFYIALVLINVPEAELVLQNIRPGPDRCIQVFEREYPDFRVMSAELVEPEDDADVEEGEWVAFRLGYLSDNRVQNAYASFQKNEEGRWVATLSLEDLTAE